MALEKFDTTKLGEFFVITMDDLRDKFPDKFNESGAMDYQWFETEIRPSNFVYIRRDKNSLSFTLQKGPVKEVGINGCQVDTVIMAARHILKTFQAEFPCRENAIAITKLDESLMWLEERKKDRESRGVEGKAEL